MLGAHVSDHGDLGSASLKQGRVQEPHEVGVTVLVPLQGKQSATKDTNCIGSNCSCVNGRMAC